MKKALLFAILSLSINAFAQNNQPTSNSIAKIRHRMELTGRTTSDFHFERNLRQAFKNQSPDQGSLIQIFDSVYEWEWNTLNIGWRIVHKEISMVYDANNFLKSNSFKDWNLDGTITYGDSTYYYFHTVLGINGLKLQDACITVYPNPTSGKFTISSKNNISSMEIYNLLGELIDSDFNINGKTSNEIDLSSHCKGIYILNIYSGGKIYNCKIVVQ